MAQMVQDIMMIGMMFFGVGFVLLILVGMMLASSGFFDGGVKHSQCSFLQSAEPADHEYRTRLAEVQRAIAQCRNGEGLRMRAVELQGTLRSVMREVDEAPAVFNANPQAVMSALSAIENEVRNEIELVAAETEVALKVHLDMAGCELESSENTA